MIRVFPVAASLRRIQAIEIRVIEVGIGLSSSVFQRHQLAQASQELGVSETAASVGQNGRFRRGGAHLPGADVQHAEIVRVIRENGVDHRQTALLTLRIRMCDRYVTIALWARIIQNLDVSTGPLACLLTSFLASLTYSRDCGKVKD